MNGLFWMVSVRKYSFTIVSIVYKLWTKNYSFFNFCPYLVMLEGSAMINILFAVIKSFPFRNFLVQTAITGAFPISLQWPKYGVV